MLFRAAPQNAADIRAFCTQFNEGIRVEYKGTFDDNVRRALPKVVSSFRELPGRRSHYRCKCLRRCPTKSHRRFHSTGRRTSTHCRESLHSGH
jgi:hypothetical protein